MTTAYWNGDYLPLEQVRISPLDRGFLFADGVYEVVAAYGGHLFERDAHVRRLERSLAALRIETDFDAEGWARLLETLVARNGGGDLAVYLQVTRGAAATRGHAFPSPEVRPSVFASASPLMRLAPDTLAQGLAAVTLDDIRWLRCEIKSIALLGNVLAQQHALEHGATETIQVRDGLVSEGASTNVFVVRNGAIATPIADHRILAGITRAVVIRLACEHGLPLAERDVSRSELESADEIWIASTTKEVAPVTRLDGRPVGDGQPGPVWARVRALFEQVLPA